ncbi:cardiolipin synthase ClsB [soil metagenome]
MRLHWTAGNRIDLLENGEAFFPRVFEVIESAKTEVLVETFILFDDKIGQRLREVLIAAASRGVRTVITVDGYGSPDLSPEFIGGMTRAGVEFHVFDPRARVMGLRLNLFRRLHRKLVVVDGVRAFVGGINMSAEHVADYGPRAKQDYAVEVEGPLVGQIHAFALKAAAPKRRSRGARPVPASHPAVGTATAAFVTRDNESHPTDIEQQYRVAIRAARREVIIANAYFLPGYRLLREIRKAARRGVTVTLILQGEPDMRWVQAGSKMLYESLLRAGVRIYEYCERPLHGKVALTDDEWATVGSSNLDPLSLSLNLEANVLIRDDAFNAHLRERLQMLIDRHCRLIEATELEPRTPWRVTVSFLMFHFLRRFPAWAGWLPAHTPRVTSAPVPHDSDESSDIRRREPT